MRFWLGLVIGIIVGGGIVVSFVSRGAVLVINDKVRGPDYAAIAECLRKHPPKTSDRGFTVEVPPPC